MKKSYRVKSERNFFVKRKNSHKNIQYSSHLLPRILFANLFPGPLDLVLDENFNESASDEFDNNLNSSTELKPNLSHEEIERILNHKFLNDTVIHYFQKLVNNVNGLQDPLLGQNLNLKECSKEFIQPLHDGRHHWVTTSTLDWQPGEVTYYDSLIL